MFPSIKNNDFVKLAFGAVATVGAIASTMATTAAFGYVAHHVADLSTSGIAWSMVAGGAVGLGANVAIFKKYKILEYVTS